MHSLLCYSFVFSNVVWLLRIHLKYELILSSKDSIFHSILMWFRVKLAYCHRGGKLEMFNMQGNSLSSETISQIGVLKNGSVVVYSEITVLSKGTFVKSKSVRYVIGARNSVPALRDPSLPDTLSAAEIGAIVLDKEVFSFQIVFVLEGAVYDFEMTGNGVAPTVKDKLLTLPAGTKVWFESIKSEDGTGAKRILPSRVFVIK